MTRLALLATAAVLLLFTSACGDTDPVDLGIPGILPPAARTAGPADAEGPTDGLWAVLPCDGHLLGWGAGGREVKATFVRDSTVYGPTLAPAAPGEPRWQPGRWGQAIFVEYGRAASSGTACANLLDPALAAADTPAPFATAGRAILAPTPGIEGSGAVLARVAAEGGGWQTPPLVTPWEKEGCTWSLYVRGAGGTELQLAATLEDAAEPVATATATLTGDWQRVFLNFTLPEPEAADGQVPTGPWGRRPVAAPVVLRATLPGRGAFAADAMMLETHAGYAHRRSPSSWIPGGRQRPGEILRLPPPPNPEAGTIAFDARLEGDLGWRCLLTIGYGAGWDTDLRLDVYDNTRPALAAGSKGGARFNHSIAPDQWHHYAVTWDGRSATLYIDGAAVGTLAHEQVGPMISDITIGGVPNNFSPGVRADAAFDEFAVWSRSLTAAEIAALAGREQPLSAAVDNHLTVRDLELIDVFARDDRRREWGAMVANRTPKTMRKLHVAWGVDGLWQEQHVIGVDLAPGTARELRLPWAPARFVAGNYTWQTRVWQGEDTPVVGWNRAIEVVAARVAAANAQIISWSGTTPAMAAAGVTVGGVDTAPHQVANATRLGMYSESRVFLDGHSDAPADHFLTLAGQEGPVDQRSATARAELDRRATELADHFARLPDIRYTILNSEHQWINQIDFRPETRAHVKEAFGLDLDRWFGRDVPAKDVWAWIHPGGRLSARKGGVAVPAGGVVPVDDPLLAFHRWWQSYQAGTEVFLNEHIIGILHQRNPTLLAIVEPTLRRPSVKPWEQADIAEEWYYFPNPATGIGVQERAAAQTRRRHPRTQGMPQFLFKPGMAAPYGGMPTPDMWRQTVWHCLARPLRGLLYWNLGSALENNGKMQTQAEIDEALGARPTWDDAKSKIVADGERSSLFLWIPELADTIGKLHHDVVRPLGALWPRWRNRPRRIAMYYSFAGEIYGEVRWGYGGGLNAAMASLQYPYDILYDDDFEEAPGCLKEYDVLLIPQGFAITRPAADQIRAWQAAGGTVVVDRDFAPDLPGVERLPAAADAPSHTQLLQVRAEELLAKYGDRDHPQFIEGMQQYADELAGEQTPDAAWLAAIITAKARREAHTETPDVYLNTLASDGANYLVVVNGHRIPGPWYGHFGRVLDVGLPQTAALDCDADLGAVAYELVTHKPVPVKTSVGRHHFALDLPPCAGRVVVFLPSAVAAVKLAKPVVEDGTFGIRAALVGADGKLVPGAIPVQVEISRPDGSRDDYSHAAVFVNGRLTVTRPVAVNDVPGVWQIVLTELASGRQARATWAVGDPKAAR